MSVPHRRSILVVFAVVLATGCGSGDATEPDGAVRDVVATTLTTSTSATAPATTVPERSAPDETAASAASDASAPSTPPPDGDADPTRLQAALDDFVERSGSPGGVVAISVAGDEPLVFTSGVADRRTGTAMPADPVIFTGKMGGQFVAAIALQLVAEGSLALDETVATYLPEAPHADEITVRQLLEHTSGFQDWLFGSDELTAAVTELVAADPSRRVTPDEMIGLMRDRPLQFAPGTDALHAEFNVLLVRSIVERITGEDFGAVLSERILGPLDLTRTTYGIDALPRSDLLPGLFRAPPDLTDRWTTDLDPTSLVTAFYAAAPIASSVSDLMAWGSAYYRDGTVIPDDIADEAAALNELGSAPQGIALTEEGVCVMLVNCAAGDPERVGFGQPSVAIGAFAGLFYHRDLDALIFVMVNNTGVSIRPLYAAVRETL